MQRPPGVLAAILMLAAMLLPACGDSSADAPSELSANIAIHEYTTRAIVALMPSAENPTAAFTVRHEAIPHFIGENGDLGMPPMEMPFPLKPGVALDGIKLGNKVEVTFAVEYDTALKRPTAYAVTRVSRLPDDTRLQFGPPPGGDESHTH